MNEELKFCPFCGGMAAKSGEPDDDGDFCYFVQCNSCGCRTDSYYDYGTGGAGIKRAIEAWNTRAAAGGKESKQ